jgi:hypothetical protein
MLTWQQDRSGNNSYDNVIVLLIVYKGLNVLWPFFYDYLDGKWLGHSLRKGEKQRVALRDACLQQGVVLRGWRPSKKGMYLVMAELGALTITAWAVRAVQVLLSGRLTHRCTSSSRLANELYDPGYVLSRQRDWPTIPESDSSKRDTLEPVGRNLPTQVPYAYYMTDSNHAARSDLLQSVTRIQ